MFPWKNVLASYTIRKMGKLKREREGRYAFVHRGESVDMAELVAGIERPARRFTGGRGAFSIRTSSMAEWIVPLLATTSRSLA